MPIGKYFIYVSMFRSALQTPYFQKVLSNETLPPVNSGLLRSCRAKEICHTYYLGASFQA